MNTEAGLQDASGAEVRADLPVKGESQRGWVPPILCGLVLATSLAVGTVSIWMVPPYLALMTLLLADFLPGWLIPPRKLRRRVIATNPAEIATDSDAVLTEQHPSMEIGVDVEPDPGSQAVSTESAQAPAPVAVTRSKRTKGRGRKGRTSISEPSPARWIQVAPGKFVRVEGAESHSPESTSSSFSTHGGEVAADPALHGDLGGNELPEAPSSPETDLSDPTWNGNTSGNSEEQPEESEAAGSEETQFPSDQDQDQDVAGPVTQDSETEQDSADSQEWDEVPVVESGPASDEADAFDDPNSEIPEPMYEQSADELEAAVELEDHPDDHPASFDSATVDEHHDADAEPRPWADDPSEINEVAMDRPGDLDDQNGAQLPELDPWASMSQRYSVRHDSETATQPGQVLAAETGRSSPSGADRSDLANAESGSLLFGHRDRHQRLLFVTRRQKGRSFVRRVTSTRSGSSNSRLSPSKRRPRGHGRSDQLCRQRVHRPRSPPAR